MNDPRSSRLDIGDLVVLGHVMAMASVKRGHGPLEDLHLCTSHRTYLDAGLAKVGIVAVAIAPAATSTKGVN